MWFLGIGLVLAAKLWMVRYSDHTLRLCSVSFGDPSPFVRRCAGGSETASGSASRLEESLGQQRQEC